MDREKIFNLIDENNWKVDRAWSQGAMLLLSRGLALIIAYPRSDKYRENGQVYKGLAERLGRRTA